MKERPVRQKFAVLILLFVMSASADGDEWLEVMKTPRAEALRVAVLEWCDLANGHFRLNKGQPSCVVSDSTATGQASFLGITPFLQVGDTYWGPSFWLSVEPERWWKLRATGTAGFRFGVLWFVDPSFVLPALAVSGLLDGLSDTGVDTTGFEMTPQVNMNLQCMFAKIAVENPAKVSVHVIGTGASQCTDIR